MIQEEQTNRNNEDYFYGLSYGSVDCRLTQTGVYTIEIGYWKTDFIGQIKVKEINRVQLGLVHILQLRTSLGSTSTKFIPLP